MMNRKVLIVAYYWPPSGGSGVQRWLKFVKYLVRYDWQPIVYTPENPSFGLLDASLLKDVPATVTVIKRPIWEPYDLFNAILKWTGKKDIKPSDLISIKKKPSTFQRLSSFIRGNFFIPDARVHWVKPSVSFLSDYLVKNNIETIVTTGPPHSMHLIGLQLKKRNPSLKWIADFRDPWSEWDLFDTLSLSSWAKQQHRKMEYLVLATADRVITIGPYHVKRLEVLGRRKVDEITNGFDEDDFKGIIHTRTNKFTIRHVGIVDELRDPRPMMYTLKEIILENPSLKERIIVEFVGSVNSQFKNDMLDDGTLNLVTRFIAPIPHDQLLRLYGTTDLQLLILAFTDIAPGNLPGKIFEYLASGNPILAIGPANGDAAHLLTKTKAGEIYERTDLAGIKQAILKYFDDWRLGNNNVLDRDVSAYSRRMLTEKLIKLFEEL